MGSPAIFNGNFVKFLKQNQNLNDIVYQLNGSADPTSSAQDAPKGSIYQSTSTGLIYRKTDAGSSTNWVALSSGASVSASYSTNAGQSIANSTLTTVLYEDIIIDTNSAYNVATGEYTVPVAGNYYMAAFVRYVATTAFDAGEYARVFNYVNGSSKSSFNQGHDLAPLSSVQTQVAPPFYYGALALNDIVTFRTSQNSGGSLALDGDGTVNQFVIFKVN